MNDAVELINISKSFGKEQVLKNLSYSFELGKIHGIVGRNGSGKTVLMKCILGFMKPDDGKVLVFGDEIGKDTEFAKDTGFIIEAPGFIATESGRNNLKYISGISGNKDVNIDRLFTLVGLDPKLKKPVSKYSLGMRQRLGIAAALLSNPKLLILDEPTNGLDNNGVDEIRKLLLHLSESGVTIILASHNPADIELLCHTVLDMNAHVK